MKWVALCGVTLVVALIVLYEWRKINPNQKNEKAAFITLTASGWVLAALLIFFPELPGPTQWVEAVFRPLGKLLEK